MIFLVSVHFMLEETEAPWAANINTWITPACINLVQKSSIKTQERAGVCIHACSGSLCLWIYTSVISCHVKVLFLFMAWQEMFVFPRGVSGPGPQPEHLCHFESRILTSICGLPTHLSGYSGTTLATPCSSTGLSTEPGTEICPWQKIAGTAHHFLSKPD